MPAPALLRGLTVPAGETPAEQRAAAILASLGAEPPVTDPAPGGSVSLVAHRATKDSRPSSWSAPDAGSATAEPFPGLPGGVAEQALALALAAATVDGALRGRPVEVSEAGVLAQLYLPAVMAASYGAPPARQCPEPLAVGSGAVQADLGAEGAAESFEALLGTLSDEEREDPERVAVAAQLWRLPVLPYRSAAGGLRGEITVAARASEPAEDASALRARRLDDPAGRSAGERRGVLDLTAMWAGPLATWLLAAGGDPVWKVESDVRLDGMRAMDGRGVHPPGADPTSGEASGMFNALNRGKLRLDLDLREPEARRALLDRAAECDLVLENFSPRVLGNLRIGYEVLADASPGITVISLPALPPGTPEADWVAYGAGVHAIGGMGETEVGFAAPAFAYPDVLAGLQAHLLALAVRFGRANGAWSGGHLIAPMSAALPPRPPTPDVCLRIEDKRRGDADRFGARLVQDGGDAEFVALTDGTGTHRYPRSPFGAGAKETPAPALHAPLAHG